MEDGCTNVSSFASTLIYFQGSIPKHNMFQEGLPNNNLYLDIVMFSLLPTVSVRIFHRVALMLQDRDHFFFLLIFFFLGGGGGTCFGL